MTQLTPDTVLQRVPNLKLEIDSSNYVQIYVPNGALDCGVYALAVLDTFSHPISFQEALLQLQSKVKGVQAWKDLTATIVQLYKAGILIPSGQILPTFRSDPYGFDAAPLQISMLNDRVRTESFLEAIRAVVREGDVVVDIGTGTGVLAIAAAIAGARHVYAIEASRIGKFAQAIFEANGVADRITLVEGWSTQIELPERADVMISETIGNEPLGEQTLEIILDARKRLLKPKARLIPRNLKIYAMAVTIPQTDLLKGKLSAENLENWQSWYGIDFSPLTKVTENSPYVSYIRHRIAKNWKTLTEPILLAEIDFEQVQDTVVDSTIVATATTSGQLDAIVVYFDSDLSPTTTLSTHPAQATEECSWRSPIWILNSSLSLQEGDRFTVTYTHGVGGKEHSVTVSKL